MTNKFEQRFKFKVGDRVRVTKDHGPCKVGDEGIVRNIWEGEPPYLLTIPRLKERKEGHDGNGYYQHIHYGCWYVFGNGIELVDRKLREQFDELWV